VDWTGTLQQQHVTFGNNVVGGQSGNPYSASVAQTPFLGFNGTTIVTNGILNTWTYGQNNTVGSPGILADTAHGFNPATAFLNADGVSAVLSFLNNEADTKVISTPRTVTLDNEMATLAVTTAEPIFQVTPSTANTPGSATVVYTNVGTILQVTPRISANNTIALRVTPEVSDDGGQRSQTLNGATYTADFFDIRRIQTQVLIPSGNTLVMGGLVSDQQSQGYTKVPGLGDIPLLGNLFRSSNKSQNKRNLLIFITPTIVQDEDFQPTSTTFLKTKSSDGKDEDFGAWDSGKPQDWSTLFHKQKQTAETDTDSSGN
jgi:type II secretory pathway component GspD/PulD (secretin)